MDSRHEAFRTIIFPAYTHTHKNKSMSISRKHHLLYTDGVLFSQAELGTVYAQPTFQQELIFSHRVRGRHFMILKGSTYRDEINNFHVTEGLNNQA